MASWTRPCITGSPPSGTSARPRPCYYPAPKTSTSSWTSATPASTWPTSSANAALTSASPYRARHTQTANPATATDNAGAECRDLSPRTVHDGSIVSLSGAGQAGADQARPGPDWGKEGKEMAILVVGEATGVTAEQDAALAKRLY